MVLTGHPIVPREFKSSPGDFGIKFRRGKIRVPAEVLVVIRKHELSTAASIVAFAMDHPKKIARSLGWTRDQAVFAAETLVDDLAGCLRGEEVLVVKMKFVHRERIRELVSRGAGPKRRKAKPAKASSSSETPSDKTSPKCSALPWSRRRPSSDPTAQDPSPTASSSPL